MIRRRMLHSLKAGADLRDYEDAAVLPLETDPQIYLSRNSLPQPFHLICEKDTVISQLSGSADVHLRDSSVNRFRMDVGDHVYIPAGTPHQIVPIQPGVTLRYLPLEAGRLGAAWYCSGCAAEVQRYEFEHDNEVPLISTYAAAASRFSADIQARTCGKCGVVHPEIDLARYGWNAAAASTSSLATH
jgi:mannose-6-phosphate isomerase-like protein (cupin superfamily)